MEFPGRTLQDGEDVIGDWFPRGGDNAIFRAQLVSAEVDGVGAPKATVTISVLTKNSETVGDGTPVTAAQIEFDTTNSIGDILESLVISTAGTSAATGLLELLRFKIVVTGGWTRVNVFAPTSFDESN